MRDKRVYEWSVKFVRDNERGKELMTVSTITEYANL